MKFVSITSHVVPLKAENVDTDQIIPARFLKVTDKKSFCDKLFYDWRYLPDAKPNPNFVLNEPASQGAQILIAGDNFGCGSSREHAPWALTGWGLRAIISTSFADIFKSNSLKNGLLPVEISHDVHEKLFAAVQNNRTLRVTVNLENQTLRAENGIEASFPVDNFAKHCLLNGIDPLGYLLSFENYISDYEKRNNNTEPSTKP